MRGLGRRNGIGRGLVVLAAAVFACALTAFSRAEVSAEGAGQPALAAASPYDKMALWRGGTQLRGANIYQRRVYPELDGPTFMGPGPVGPPYTQADLDRLAAWGANYVNISHPGLFSEVPPYELDMTVQSHLDALLTMAARADLFAVISFRTGPGRSEFTFFDEDWFDPSYRNDEIWRDPAAQDAWVAMWRATAEHYRGHPIVAGYDLMVEPNANGVWLDIWEPDEFYPAYAGTLYDWNTLYPRVVAAIREVDPDTPILVGGMSYSSLDWLPYLQPLADTRTVYTFHQYAPHVYTHQAPDDSGYRYPGRFDTDWDGHAERFDRAWLESYMDTARVYSDTYGLPVAVNEFGVVRWAPGAGAFLGDEMDLFEELGFNYAIWLWETSWDEYAAIVDEFDPRHGPNPSNHQEVTNSPEIETIKAHWARNTVRPSTRVGVEEHVLTLSQGYNLISLPVYPVDPRVEVVLAPVMDDLLAAWSYDAADPESPWQVYVPSPIGHGDLAVGSDTLDHLDPSHGYWLQMADDATLPLVGTVGVTTAIPLVPGWNLVGYPTAATRPVSEALADVADALCTVWAFDPQEGHGWQFYSPDAPPWACSLEELRPGLGYWIEVTQPVTWQIPIGPAPCGDNLATVNDFLYQLQSADLDAIGQTAFDLVVLDYSADGGPEAEYTAAETGALKASPGGPKVVLAYMSIGEAEEYRFYWQPGWRPGNPAWLGPENPDWEGNYKVRYWDPAWQAIVMSYTDRILSAGFDGVYLDIIDAYEFWAARGRATAAQEMADLVAAIRAHARAHNPCFQIVVQNAAELAALVPGYLDSVDGIGQEDIYYGYTGDDEITPAAVTAEMEANLDRFLAAGKRVLTIDYATTPAHIAAAYARSRAKGYVPYVTVRELDQLLIHPGYEPD